MVNPVFAAGVDGDTIGVPSPVSISGVVVVVVVVVVGVVHVTEVWPEV